MSKLLIKNGRVICPDQGLDRVTSILVDDGRIAAYDVDHADGAQVIDAAGKIVAPGLIDLHTQLREPGCEEDETIESGTATALASRQLPVCRKPIRRSIPTQASSSFAKKPLGKAIAMSM